MVNNNTSLQLEKLNFFKSLLDICEDAVGSKKRCPSTL